MSGIEKSVMTKTNSNVLKTLYSFFPGLVILILLFIVSRYNYLIFHTLAEFFSIVVAWSLFAIVWNTRMTIKNDALVFLGIAYLFIGGLDLFHTLSYKGMGVLGPERGANPATQLWIIARYMESISLCLFPLFFGKRLKLSFVIWIYSIITGIVLSAIFFWGIFPDCYIDGAGLTLFKKNSEYIICIFLAAAFFFLTKKKNLLDQTVFKLLSISIILTIIGELAFTFYVSVYGLSNLVGHFFKIISFFLIYLALIRSGLRMPYETLFFELKNSEDEMKSIFRAAPTGIGVVCDRNLQQLNDRFCEMVGYSKNELIGQSARVLYPSDEEYEYVGKEKYKQISKKGTGTVETKLLRKDGNLIDVILSSTPIDLNDLSKGVTFTALDITYLKTKELELLESKEKYRSMMESMKDAAYISSPEFRIEYMNPAMIDRVGEDALGELCHKAIYGRDEKCSWCVFDQIQQKEHVEYEVADPKDNHYYMVTNSPISHTDGTVSKLTIFRDITAIKAMEGSLRQAQKMDSLGTLTGGIAHDFNNLLYMIVGNTELALEDIPKWNPVHSNLEEIKSASLRASGIVKQLLNFSRKADQEMEPIGTIAVIKDAIKFMRSTIPTTIEIRKQLPDTEVTILGDPSQINQVMMNLCTNASQAMEETGGILTINVEALTLDKNLAVSYPDLSEGDYLKIRVSDTGPGINAKIIEQIFDPYFTTKEMGKGSGMGLSIVHGIVRNHNGAITVDNKLDKGTTFTILFPVVDEKLLDDIAVTEEQLFGTESILFVDDEESITNMTGKMLERLGYRVETRLNSLEALSLFQSEPDSFDLVITDMTMPQMTGAKLSEKLMEIRSDIPVIICTGHSSLINEEKAKKLGIAAYVMKPSSMSKIAKAIRKVLDK